MAKYTNGQVTYNNVIKPSFLTSGRLAKGSYQTDEENNLINKPGPLVNAIDIDWNGATINDLVVNNTSDLLERLDNTYTKSETDENFQTKGDYLTEHQSLEGYATEEYVNNRISDLVGAAPETLDTLEELAQALGETGNMDAIRSALESKANVGDSYTKEESDSKYLTEHQSLEGYATEAMVAETYQPKGDYLTEHQDLSAYATKQEIEDAGYLTEHQDLSAYATKQEIEDAGYLTEHQDLSELEESIAIVANDLQQKIDNTQLSAYATKQEIEDAGYLTEHQSLEGYATEAMVAETYQPKGDYLTEHQDLSAYATKQEIEDAGYIKEHQSLEGYATEAMVAETYQPKGDYLTEHQDLSAYATKQEIEDAGYLTEHQSLEGYATEIYVDDKFSQIVGTAPQNFDTLEELAAVMGDLKVVDTPAQEATYYEEGDELPEGVQVGDEKTPAVEEVSHNMTISEFVNETMQSVNEKPEIAALTKRLSDLEKFVNRYVTLTPEQQQTVANDATVTETLANTTSVTIEEGTIADIVVPETTKSTTITGELDPNSTLELTSPKGVTINNTGTEPTNLVVNAPANGSTPTVTLKSGVYDTVTVQDASLTVSNDATVQNVVITPETTKSTTINATFVEGATITSNSEAPITVTNKNVEGEEVSVTLNAPGSTVTLSGGKWTTISGEVSENTLIIKGSAKIQSLNLTKGNVIVEVPREEDIHNVITGEITLGEGYTCTYRKYDITNENSSKLGGIGEMTLQEDITRTSSIVAPLAPAYNAVWILNGHNITVEGTPKSGVYLNRYTSNLEVKGNGVIHAEGSYGLWNSTTTGKIIVNDGVTVEAQTHAIYAEKGTIEINGGSFKLTNADVADKDENGNFKFLLNCYDANYKAGTANIIVKGGKFYGFNPAESYGEPNGPVNFVAEGYESVPTNEAYEYGTVYEVRPISE